MSDCCGLILDACSDAVFFAGWGLKDQWEGLDNDVIYFPFPLSWYEEELTMAHFIPV
jgi:hypothetical protein